MEYQVPVFDLVTQRFIRNRWKTPTGREVLAEIKEAVKLGHDLADILMPYELEHPSNVEPYEFPYYPPDAIAGAEFWVLSAKKSLNYAAFIECTLVNLDLEMSDLSNSQFERCDLSNAIFAYTNAHHVDLDDSKLRNTYFLGSYFKRPDFSGCDLRGAYFEETVLKNLKVNYLTKFDRRLQRKWHERVLAEKHLPDLYRAIRMGYQQAELYNYADHYLLQERIANRKYIIWQRLLSRPSVMGVMAWGKDFAWSIMTGYGTKPMRTVFLGIFVSFIYSLIYLVAGPPLEGYGGHSGFLGALYFSFTTFATLGYGDLTYGAGRHVMRLVSTSEAIMGAVLMALFVVVIARKMMR